MSQEHYLLSETEVDRLRELFESFHWMVFEFIEKRKIQTPGVKEESPEYENFQSIYEELDLLNQEKFDF